MGVRESLDPDASMWDWIACDLRFYREKAGDTGTKIGELIDKTRQSVSNMEAGRSGYRLTEKGAAILDAHWHTNGHFGRLLRYARSGHDADWFQEHTQYEARASVMKIYESSVVPGLLQTPEYARALLTAGRQVTDIDAAVEARMSRQEILNRTPAPRLWVLLNESVIDQPVGGSEVMRGQLSHLLALMELPNVTIRIVPRKLGAHIGLDGSFMVTTTDSGEVVYLESCGGGRLDTDKAEVMKFSTRFDQIGSDALSRDASRDLILQVMKEL